MSTLADVAFAPYPDDVRFLRVTEKAAALNITVQHAYGRRYVLAPMDDAEPLVAVELPSLPLYLDGIESLLISLQGDLIGH